MKVGWPENSLSLEGVPNSSYGASVGLRGLWLCHRSLGHLGGASCGKKTPTSRQREILLMAEILHHLGCIKPCK